MATDVETQFFAGYATAMNALVAGTAKVTDYLITMSTGKTTAQAFHAGENAAARDWKILKGI